MKRSNRLVILVGVLLAVLAFVAIVILLNDPDGSSDGPTATPATATVLVATSDIALGDPVTSEMVEIRQINPEAVLAPALIDPSQLQGQPARYAVRAGSQVTAELVGLADGPTTCIACLLNPGEKAVTFQVDRVTGADFLIREGDTIDIILSQQISVLQETADSAANTDPEAAPRFEAVTGLENQRTVKAILQDKRVLHVSSTQAIEPEPVDTNGDGVVDGNDQQPEQAAVDSVIIIFAGSDADAEVIKFAQSNLSENGFLGAVIRHADDDVPEDTTGITIDQLVEAYGLRIPAIVEQLNEDGTETPAP